MSMPAARTLMCCRCRGSFLLPFLNDFFPLHESDSRMLILAGPERRTVEYGSLLNGIARASPMIHSPVPGPR
jgi:hypothetical protein